MYSKELDVAVRVVHMACSLCQRVQEGLASTSSDQVKSKDDDSPVTVAGTLKRISCSSIMISSELVLLHLVGFL